MWSFFKNFFKLSNPWERIYRNGTDKDLKLPYENFPQICDFLVAHNSNKILDVTVGNGRHSLELIKRQFEVYGFDLSEKIISFAKDNIKKTFPKYDLSRFISANMFKDYPYEDEFFDGVIAIQAIYHGFRSDMDMAINEVARVLKKRGSFVFTVSKDKKRSTLLEKSLLKRGDTILKIEEMTYLPLSGREKGLVHFYPSKKEIIEMLDEKFTHVIISEDKFNKYYIVYCLKK